MNKKREITIGINASFARKPYTGIGQVTINFLKELVKKNKEGVKFILYLEEDFAFDFELPDNFRKNIFLPAWKRDDLLRKIMWEKGMLPKRAKKDGCDIFLSLYQSTTVMPKKIHHIMMVHDIIPKLFPEYLNNSRKKTHWKGTEKAILKADKIMSVSAYTKSDLVKHLGVDQEKVEMNHIDVDEIYKKEVSEKETQKVLGKYNLESGYIYAGGGLEVRKNIGRLIEAYKTLLEKKPDVPSLVISGKLMPELSPLVSDIERIVSDLNLSEKVKILDFVPQDELPALYKNAKMFVYPSLYEGFGMPVLEAMNQGAPVISSSEASLPEVGGEAVLYCNALDVDDIAQKMEKLLTDEDLRNWLSEKGKERAKEFSWRRFVEKTLHLIDQQNK